MFCNDYFVLEITNKTTGLSSPNGIICRENDILICDVAANNIRILDLSGNKLSEIGKLGNAPLEFIRPTGIAQTDQYIYVIDSGNDRIQVLDHNFTFVYEIALPHFLSEEYFIDIAVTAEESICLSTNCLGTEDSHISILLLILFFGKIIITAYLD